jgi:cyclic pyranopterin phosphate synthase
MGERPVDQMHRPLRDLRVSVTDRCNFRCAYCMPRELFGPDHVFLPREHLLSFEEIARLTRVFAGLGVRKVRLTGGEPLLRQHLDRLVAMVAAVDGIEDIALTTNGALLASAAERLRAAGLRRVTVSLDSVDPAVFAAMADTRIPLSQVLDGVDAAVAAGFAPVKVNAVVKRGVNEDGLLDLVDYARDRGLVLRFIEYMDVGTTNGWRMDDVVPATELLGRVAAAHPVEPVEAAYRGEVARRYRYLDGRGEVGFITSVTQPFCDSCTRARLTAVGELYTCLFGAAPHDLRALLRGGADDEQLAAAVTGVWTARDDRYSALRTAASASLPRPEMSYLGG